MTPAPLASRKLWAYSALLLGLFAACSESSKDTPNSGSSGNANQAGAAGEPASSGSGGSSSSGKGGGNAAGDSGAPAADGGAEIGGAAPFGGAAGAGGEPEGPTTSVYGASVESFTPGTSAGYNQDKMPGIVLGPPVGEGNESGSLDVASLGAAGEIVLAFGNFSIVDGPGPDLVVFENAFWPSGDASAVFAELGEVSVSEDGETWETFPCDAEGDGEGNFPGCAGVTPTLVYDAEQLMPLDPAQSGGDAFDLADLGLKRARFVKIRDLETLPPGGTSAGFDLDAVGVIHAR
jgi:hypothetical protein